MTDDAALLYLDLLKRCVVNLIYEDPAIRYPWDDSSEQELLPFDRDKRMTATDWPSQAHTMIGMRRLDNIQELVTDVLATGTPGDLIETGVWRGGSTIFMRGMLEAHGVRDRSVWVADSFEGFPSTEEQGASERSFSSPELANLRGYQTREYAPAFRASMDRVMEGTSLEAVRDRFDRYGLLDEQVKFLPGWFRDTLPLAPIERLALLRLDGDLYDSTYDALDALYPRLSVGGYAIVDDYGFVAECRQAVHDYLGAAGVEADLQRVDDDAVFWQKRA
jgi:Macrocin-O-methyltransferase (TylF)